MALRAFGGAEKIITASLLLGSDCEAAQVELVRIGSRRELLRKHEGFHGGQFGRRRQPEIRIVATAVARQSSGKVLSNRSRHELLQVRDIAAEADSPPGSSRPRRFGVKCQVSDDR